MATNQSFYNAEKFEQRGRSIRLNEVRQEVPTGPLKVVDAKKQKALNNPTLEYPILVLQDQDGNRYDVMAWERDVLKCGQEWGNVHPKDWGYVVLKLNDAKTRFEVVPAEEQPIEQENV